MNIALTWRGEAIFTRLSFSLVGYAILKDFSYLFGAKFTGRKFYRDLMTIDQEENEWYFTPVRTQLMSIIFFPREFIICFKSVQAKQVDLEMFAARSVAARPNTLKLASLTLKNLRAVDLQQV